MTFPRFEVVQLVICSLAAIVFLISRLARSADRRLFAFLLSIFLVLAVALLQFKHELWISAGAVISILLIALGLSAYIYDARRLYRSASKNLRNLGGIYVFIGLACLFSLRAHFPVMLWGIPVVLFALGYFFLRRKRGLANLCKGAGILVSVAFIASMLYDIRVGALPDQEAISLRERLIPEIVKPSIIEDLNALNEKLGALEKENMELTEELQEKRALCSDLQAKLEIEEDKWKDVERKEKDGEQKQIDLVKAKANAVIKLKEAEMAKATVEKKLEEVVKAKAESESKYEKEKASAKESFSNLDEKIKRYADNLNEAVKERDKLRAELETLKSAPTPAPSTAVTESLEAEIASLTQQLEQKQEERAKLAAELQKSTRTIDQIREVLSAEQ